MDLLDKKTIERFKNFINVIDNTQFKLLNFVEKNSNTYFKRIQNTTKADLIIYSSLLFHDDFILLPGDDVSEKKHMNIKNLMIQREKEGGYVKKTNRGTIEKWKGLPRKAFEIDYEARPEYKPQIPVDEEGNEIIVKEAKKAVKKEAKKEAKKEGQKESKKKEKGE